MTVFTRLPFACRLPSLATATAIALALAACNADRLSPQEHIRKARQFLSQGEPRSALVELKNALQRDGSNADGRLLLADTYLALDNGQDAEAEIDRAVQLGAPVESTLVRRGKAYLLQGKYDRLLKELATDKDGNPYQDLQILEMRGDAQLASGLTSQAVKTFDQILAVRQDSVHALVGKARTFARSRDVPQSMQLVERALAVEPQNVPALLLKGDLLSATGKQEDAIKAYGAAVKINPSNAVAQLALASSLMFARRFSEAKEHIAVVSKISPNLPSANYLNALMEFSQGHFKASALSVQKVLDVLPNDPPTLILNAAIQYSLGAMPQAEANTRRFLSSYPDSVYAKKLLASTLLKQNQAIRAFEVLEPLVAPPGVADPQVFAIAGNALVEADQPAKALAYLARAASMAPTDAAIQTAYGLGSLSNGKVDQAIGSFESVMKLDTSNSKAESYLVLSYIGKKEFRRAIEVATATTEREPKNANAFNLLGGAYLAGSNVTGARTAFEKALSLEPGLGAAAVNLARIDGSERKPALARKHLTDVLVTNPKNLAVLLALAQLEFTENQPDAGAKWLASAIAANPEAVEPKVLELRYLLKKGDAQRAFERARDADTKFPNNLELMGSLAEAQAMSGNRNAAVATYGRLAGLSNDPRYQVQIARLELADNHLAAASSALAKALTIDPNLTEAQVTLAGLYVQQRRFDDARKIADRLVGKPATAVAGQTISGDAWMLQSNYERAARAYESALALRGTPQLVIKLHAALSQSGRKPVAETVIKKWTQDNPTDTVSRLYLAGLAKLGGDPAGAEALYRDVLRIDADNIVALNEAALIVTGTNSGEALALAERAYKLRPNDGGVADTYGWILYQHGDREKARAVLDRAVAADPANADARYHLAVALMRLGNKSGALVQLEAALQSRASFEQRDAAQRMFDDAQ